MKRIRLVLLLCLLGLSLLARAAETLTVAVAADLKFAMAELASNFEKSNPGCHVEAITGSSGKFYQQIVNGAPFDLFFSADIEYPRKLMASGLTASEVKPYAVGRLALWSARQPVDGGLPVLVGNQFVKVAIANPQHAPYGKAAKASLAYYGLLDKIGPKLIFGENVAQAAQFAQTGSTEAAIIALSLAKSPNMQGQGSYYLIDEKSHPPLEQGYVTLKRAAANPCAEKFAAYMESKEARAIFRKYGFQMPGEP